ncbi:kelch repeat-containing protein [Archangium sp.]|uniref:kelch repeat-containing protein n=1 Tax=Archangium sp. TaxID=1872627 RepID=UPI0039C8B5A2
MKHLCRIGLMAVMSCLGMLGCMEEQSEALSSAKARSMIAAPAVSETSAPAVSETSALDDEEPPQEERFWSTTGSMDNGRLLHTATLLRDGRVLAVGGYNRTAELYDPVTGSWSRTSDALTSHRSATATATWGHGSRRGCWR